MRLVVAASGLPAVALVSPDAVVAQPRQAAAEPADAAAIARRSSERSTRDWAR